jgi:HSP20 family protein
MADIYNIDIVKELGRIGKEVQELVNKVVPVIGDKTDYLPACDILETKQAYHLNIDLPGLARKDIKVALEQNVIRVSGQRTIDLPEGATFEKKERLVGAFTRSFALPSEVVKSGIKAKFNLGVLSVELPKVTKESTNDIEVE